MCDSYAAQPPTSAPMPSAPSLHGRLVKSDLVLSGRQMPRQLAASACPCGVSPYQPVDNERPMNDSLTRLAMDAHAGLHAERRRSVCTGLHLTDLLRLDLPAAL